MRILCFFACVFCAFVTPAISASLPSGYTELEYLQSSGTQYIDTGVTCSTTSELSGSTVDFQIIALSGTRAAIACARNYPSWNGYMAFADNDVFATLSTYGVTYSQTADVYARTTATFGTSSVVSSNPMLLFAYTTTNPNPVGSVKMYNAKFKSNGSLVRNFIPAKRNSDNTLGMYDTAWDGSQYGVVDLGTRSFIRTTNNGVTYFYFAISNAKQGLSTANFYCNDYINDGLHNIPNQDKSISQWTSGGKSYTMFSIRVDAWADKSASEIPALVSGVMFYYQRTTDASFHGPFYTNAGTGVFTGGPEIGIKVATTAYVEESFKDSVDELNNTIGTIKNVVDNTIIQADRIGKLHTGKQNRPAENCPDGAQCLLITEADGSLHWYPICDENGNIGTQSSN